ncbi:hypothetical protein D3C76_1213040 [compost metagenome]
MVGRCLDCLHCGYNRACECPFESSGYPTPFQLHPVALVQDCTVAAFHNRLGTIAQVRVFPAPRSEALQLELVAIEPAADPPPDQYR